jgi:hypothetical protein
MSSGLSFRIIFALLLISSAFWKNVSARRSRRYPSYDHNEVDVLKGLESGEYDQIYIHYHGCVWSEFGDGYGCGNEGNQDAEDDATWYLGRTQCYRANVAYALYGIRSGDRRKKHPSNICKKRRYFINSFFTQNGLETFGQTVGLANGDDASSSCTMEDNDNGENNNNAEGDDNVNQQRQNGEIINANAQSYTTYCTGDGNFVTALFGGSYCSDKRNLQSIDSLDALNSELESVGCMLVYTKDQGNEVENEDDEAANDHENEQAAGGQNGEGRRLTTRILEEEQGENNASGGLLNLLAYSNACSLVAYPRGCPDPFGAKKRFDLNASRSSGFRNQFMWLDWLSLACFLLSIVLLVMAFGVYRARRRRVGGSSNKSKRKGSLWSGSSSNTAAGQTRSISHERNGTNNSRNKEASTSFPSDSDDTQNSQNKRKKGFFRGLFTRKNNGRS